MDTKKESLRTILTPTLRWFLIGEFFAGLSDMYGLFMPLFMSELGATVVDIGLVFSVSGIVPLVLNTIGGWLSDTYGRLRTITWGNIAGILSFAVMILANRWEWMILVFSLAGISGALGGPSHAAFIADNTAEEHRAKVYAVQQNLSSAIYLIMFPLAGLIIEQCGFKAMLLVAGGFYLVASIVFAILERTSRLEVESNVEGRSRKSFRTSLGVIGGLIVAGGLFTWLFAIDHINDIFIQLSQPLQVLYFEEVVGASVQQLGFLPTIGAFVSLFVTVPLGYWVDKHGENVGMGLGYFLLIFWIGIPLIARNFYALIPTAVLHAIMIGLAAPAQQSLISKAVPEDRRGIAFGLTWTSRGLVSLPSPYIGGMLWDRYSPRTPFLVTIVGACVLSVLAWLKLKVPTEDKSDPLSMG